MPRYFIAKKGSRRIAIRLHPKFEGASSQGVRASIKKNYGTTSKFKVAKVSSTVYKMLTRGKSGKKLGGRYSAKISRI